jgi:hypothetical protein
VTCRCASISSGLFIVSNIFSLTVNSLFNEFKNKTEICNAITEVKLSQGAVTKRVYCMSNDNEQQLWKDLEICESFSLWLDKSTDVSDVSQLLVFIQMVLNVGR